MSEIFVFINHYFTLFFVFPSIVFLGIYMTLRLKGVQFTKFFMGLKYLFKKEAGAEGDLSHYEAVAAVLASNFGTGNIAGMAIALSVGGPGACLWMWVMTFFGMVLQYANCLLGVKYRTKDEAGEYCGGAMYYLSAGLRMKVLAAFFALAVIFAAFACGGFAQINSMTLPLLSLGVPGWISGSLLAIFVGLVVVGGAKRVAQVSSAVVPVMAFLYLGTALVILVLHVDRLGDAFALMFQSAFGLKSAVGGVVGFALIKAITTGFDRAIFATDAGTGAVPLLQSGAKTTNPVIDGVVSLVAPIIVMIVCTATALVLIVTGAFSLEGLQSTDMVTRAFSDGLGSHMGVYIVMISLVLFGYTTTIAWASCLQRAVTYLFGMKYVKPFLWFYILMVPVGALMDVRIAWVFADISLTTMLVINLIGVAGLSKEVIVDTKHFFARGAVNEDATNINRIYERE